MPTLARIGTCRPMGFSPASMPEGFQGASGKPFGAPAGAYPCPGWGMTRRLWRGLGLAVLWVLASFGARRFPKGERKALWCARRRIPLPWVGIDAPTAAREQGLCPMVSRQLWCPKVSKWRAESPLVRPQAHTSCPGWGLTRRLRRESGICRPMGRSHFSFGGERKVCKRKPAARRLREKALYCPFLKEGVRNVARRAVGKITPAFERARAHSFPLSKRARLFPSAAYRRPRPRGRHKAYASLAGWEASAGLGGFRSTDKQQGDLNALRLICNKKGQRGFESMLAFEASQEAS